LNLLKSGIFVTKRQRKLATHNAPGMMKELSQVLNGLRKIGQKDNSAVPVRGVIEFAALASHL
jgi:hypothetical protein